MHLIVALLLAAQPAAESPEARTRRVLDLVLAREYARVYEMFNPQMRHALTLEKFRESSAPMESLGKPEVGVAAVRSDGPYSTVAIPVKWPGVSLEFSVTWSGDGLISGMWFRPPAPPPPSTRPPYSRPSSFTEREVVVGKEPWRLPGTLTIPAGKGPFAAVVLVHGSGPHDRDERIGPNRPFRDLAEGLASRGMAVLRYEKRTKAYPAQCAADPGFTMSRETVDDAIAAAALLRESAEIDPKRVFVLGHSQGGYMMPRIVQADERWAGGIVMAGNARPLEKVVVEQLEYLAGLPGATEAQRKALADARNDPWKVLPVPLPYRKDLEKYDPVAEMQRVRRPLLFLQGGRDYQVTLADLEIWRKAVPSATFRIYPDLNHLFMTGKGRATPAEYGQAGFVDENIVRDIDTWIRETR